jgi:hypothetical protein
MEQRPANDDQQAPGATSPVTPEPAAFVPKYGGGVTTPTVDRFPKSAQDWAAFAALPAEVRSAAYLKSIRSMLVFFTVLTILGIVAAVVFALLGIHAIDQSQTQVTTNPFG